MRPEAFSLGKVDNRHVLLVNTHGSHASGIPGDDGRRPVPVMIHATLDKGVIPWRTGHNTVQGIDDVRAVMEAYGLKKLVGAGVEFGYSIETYSFEEAARMARMMSADESTRSLVVTHPSAEQLVKKGQTGFERSHLISIQAIRECRAWIEQEVVKAFDSPKTEVLDQYTDLIGQATIDKIAFDDFLKGGDDTFKNIFGTMVALANEDEFPLFYLWVLEAVDRELAPFDPETVQAFYNLTPFWKIGLVGYFYWQKYHQRPSTIRNQGELICLFPDERRLTEQMIFAVDEWREHKYYRSMPLISLLNFLSDRLGENDYRKLFKLVPHPFSIDSVSLLGKVLTRYKKGKGVQLYSPELFMEEIASEIDGIEVLNAAHPGASNFHSVSLANNNIFADKGTTGGADDHHPAFSGAAATMIAVEELSAHGILEALKQGPTIPISGYSGAQSLGWGPFLDWLCTLRGESILPTTYYNLLDRAIDPRNTGLEVLKGPIFPQKGRTKLTGWVYLDRQGNPRIASAKSVKR